LQQLGLAGRCSETVAVASGQNDSPPNRALHWWRHEAYLSAVTTRGIRAAFPVPTVAYREGERPDAKGSVC
jgi:hypothetical protein